VAPTAIAIFADVHRFASAKHVASYAGLVSSTYQSGACDRHGHITKRGAAELRTMLCEAAHHARRLSHPLNPSFTNLCARRGYKIAIVAIAHRLCRLLYALLRDGAEFQPARLDIEEGPFTQTITRRFRLTPRNRRDA
jgi:transposase